MQAQANKLAGLLERGRKLCETSIGINESESLVKAKGWKELVEGIKDENTRVFTALMLENYRQHRANLDEATTSLQVGNYDKWSFPLLTIVSENLVAQKLVSVQPLDGPNGHVFYMNFVTGQQKGNVGRGAKIWDSRTGHADRNIDSSDRIEQEAVGATGTGGVIEDLSLSYTPIIPGTLAVTIDPDGTPVSLIDDGNGNLVNIASSTNVATIDYSTGALAAAAGDATSTASLPIVTSYNYNSELNANAQQVDIEVQGSPIFVRERKLRVRWTQEAAMALEALFKVNADSNLSTATANHLHWEIDREIIEDLRRQAGAGQVVWNAALPSGAATNYTIHKLTLVDALVTASGFIQRATNRAKATWGIFGQYGSNIIETLPQFEPKNEKAEIEGISELGTLGRLDIYSDPHFRVDEGLLGYKGNDLLRAGYVFAPWVLLFSTPLVTLDDFISRKGFASQYGKKMINSKMYANLKLVGYTNTFGG